MTTWPQSKSRLAQYLWPLLLLLGLTLFPYGWLVDRWPLFARLVDFVFESELSHTVGHFALFALVGTAVLLTFPGLRRQPRRYMLLILMLGTVQELLQLATFKHRFFSLAETYDVLVDLRGAALAFFCVWRLTVMPEDKPGNNQVPS